jgi:small subunit ribosomal protein S1
MPAPRRDAVAPAEEAQRTDAPPRQRARLDETSLLALAEMGADELAAAMAGTLERRRVEEGDRASGTVTYVGKEHILVDVGAKSEASLERAEAPNAVVGDTVEAFVIAVGPEGVRLSTRLSGSAAGAFVDAAAESGIPVEGTVVTSNKGGFEVRIGDVRAFCPISHMELRRITDPESYHDRVLTFQVIEAGDKIVVSRRKLLETAAEGERDKFWLDLREGDRLKGPITNIQPFGAFVSLGPSDGLVPKRELLTNERKELSAFAVGEILNVRVIGLDKVARKITLSAREGGPVAEDSADTSAGSPGFGTFGDLLKGLALKK